MLKKLNQMNTGILVMNEATWWELKALAFQTGYGGSVTDDAFNGGLRGYWGKRTLVVSNDLMPTLGDDSTEPTYDVQGTNLNITHSIFHVDPNNWVGRENGTLRFDMSTDAAYTSPVTSNLNSAFERDEMVLRGYHFLSGAIPQTDRVSGVRAEVTVS